MIFSIRKGEQITWPDKCVWCGRKSVTGYTIYGIGTIGDKTIGSEWNRLEIAKVNYPVCKKHWWWSLGVWVAYLISFLGILFGWIIHPILLFGFAGMFVFAIRLHPVKIKGVTDHFYKIIIRKDEYGREFALLNGLNLP